MKKECKLCEGYLEKGICSGDENGNLDKTGEQKCFRLKNKLRGDEK